MFYSLVEKLSVSKYYMMDIKRIALNPSIEQAGSVQTSAAQKQATWGQKVKG